MATFFAPTCYTVIHGDQKKLTFRLDGRLNIRFSAKHVKVARMISKRKIFICGAVHLESEVLLPLSDFVAQNPSPKSLYLLRQYMASPAQAANLKIAGPIRIWWKPKTWSSIVDYDPIETGQKGWYPTPLSLESEGGYVCPLKKEGGRQPAWAPWHVNINVNRKYKMFTGGMRVFAYDYEAISYPGEVHIPYMLAVVEKKAGAPPFTVGVYEGLSLTEAFLIEVFAMAGNTTKPTIFLFWSFNGSKYDHAHICHTYYAQKFGMRYQGIIEPRFAKGAGKLVVLGFRHVKSKSQILFRDVLQYLPAGTAGSLASVCATLKLQYTKRLDTTLDELNQVGEAVLERKAWTPESRALYEKVRDYCIRDCNPMFEIAGYTGRTFASIKRAWDEIFSANKAIPEEFQREHAFAIFGFTLPNIAFVFIPYDQSAEFQRMLGETYNALTSHSDAQKARRSIVGGRCLSPFTAHIIQTPADGPIQTYAVDVSSEYPAASVGPLPGGAPYYLPLYEIQAINVALEDGSFRPDSFRPFIALVRIYRERDVIQHTKTSWGRVCHLLSQACPFVPYRANCKKGIDDPLVRKTGPLEWIDDTNGTTKYAFYTSVTCYTAMQRGFIINIDPSRCVQNGFWPIGWEKWTMELGHMFQDIYVRKNAAKQAKDSLMELLMKIFLNASIGKFGERPTEVVDESNPVRLKQARPQNTSLYQINSFIMAHKDRVAAGMMAWAITDDIFNLKAMWDPDQVYKRLVMYTDTDNCIFQTNESAEEVEEALKKAGLIVDGTVGVWHPKEYQVKFRLEIENWHSCIQPLYDLPQPVGLAKPVGKPLLKCDFFFSLARKVYIWVCSSCGAIRCKCKGHMVCKDEKDEDTRIGFRSLPFIRALRCEGPLSEFTLFNESQGDLCEQCINEAMFARVTPHVDADAGVPFMTSGARTTFKKIFTTANSVPFIIQNSTVERAVQLAIAGGRVEPFQRFCPLCYTLVHQ